MVSKKLVQKYYLYKKSSLFLPLFFLTLAVIIWLQQIEFLSIVRLFSEGKIKSVIDMVTGVYSFLIITVVATLFSVLHRFFKDIHEKESKEYLSPIYIDSKKIDRDEEIEFFINRSKQIEELTKDIKKTHDDEKYFFFVGKNGSGKSFMIREYYKKLKSKKHILTHNDYIDRPTLVKAFDQHIDEHIYEKNEFILIFDQFEKAIENKEVLQELTERLKAEKYSSLRLIFVSADRDFVKMLEIVSGIKDSYHIHFLQLSEAEGDEILERCEKTLSVQKNSLLYNFTKDYLRNRELVRMIEIRVIFSCFENQAVRTNFENEIRSNPQQIDIRSLVGYYFDLVFAHFKEPEVAYIILYAMSRCDFSDALTKNDFKNLTFASESTIKETLDKLGESDDGFRIIKQLTGGNGDVKPYIMTHDYLNLFLSEYCKNKLFEQIERNICVYCIERSTWRKKTYDKFIKISKKNNKNEQEIQEIQMPLFPLSSYYKDAISNRIGEKRITRALFILFLGVFAVSITYWIFGYDLRILSTILGNLGIPTININYDWNSYLHGAMLLTAGSATYYVYHYLIYFARIFFSKRYEYDDVEDIESDERDTKKRKSKPLSPLENRLCSVYIVYGVISMILTIVVYGLWGIWIAIGWSFVAFLHFFMSKKIKNNEQAKKRLAGECMLFFIIPIIITGFNIVLIYENDLSHYWLWAFFIFVCFTCRQHINSDYILTKLTTCVNLGLEEDTKEIIKKYKKQHELK
jgi:hypothetical protein